jgi:hypothetical protein
VQSPCQRHAARIIERPTERAAMPGLAGKLLPLDLAALGSSPCSSPSPRCRPRCCRDRGRPTRSRRHARRRCSPCRAPRDRSCWRRTPGTATRRSTASDLGASRAPRHARVALTAVHRGARRCQRPLQRAIDVQLDLGGVARVDRHLGHAGHAAPVGGRGDLHRRRARAGRGVRRRVRVGIGALGLVLPTIRNLAAW